MTDKELLELAAKAIYGEMALQMLESGWNPLTDDGDAFRLNVALEFNLYYAANQVFVEDFDMDIEISSDIGKDKNSATRRAIVRAAAEIGKNLTKNN